MFSIRAGAGARGITGTAGTAGVVAVVVAMVIVVTTTGDGKCDGLGGGGSVDEGGGHFGLGGRINLPLKRTTSSQQWRSLLAQRHH